MSESKRITEEEVLDYGFQAINDRLIILVDKKDEMTAGGLYIPDELQEKSIHGKILSVGDKVKSTLSDGDEVYFSKRAGMKLLEDYDNLLVMKEDDLLCKRSR